MECMRNEEKEEEKPFVNQFALRSYSHRAILEMKILTEGE